MRFRLIDLMNWTTAIAVVLFLVFRVVAPIVEAEKRIARQAAVAQAAIVIVSIFIVGHLWIRLRVTSPRDQRIIRYTLWGAVIGAFIGAFSGLGTSFLRWRADFPVDELGAAVGVLLGLVPGAFVGLILGVRGFLGVVKPPQSSEPH